MKLFRFRNNTKDFKKFLIPKSAEYNCTRWVEITVDFQLNEFVAKKVNGEMNPSDEWEETQEYTFPSSLMSEFLRDD
jgi:hypothetical protein